MKPRKAYPKDCDLPEAEPYLWNRIKEDMDG